MKGAVHETVQDRPGGFQLGALSIGLLQLTQYLGLAHHHGIEAGGDFKDVPHRIHIGKEVKTGQKTFLGKPPQLRKHLNHGFLRLGRVLNGHQEFNTVAG